jgi:vacuolar-type H+-ATPase subunit I/STV1
MSELPEPPEGGNKRTALLIAILALLLAFAEAGNSNNENLALESNIEASNLWSFFQAKTIRSTVLKTAAEQMEIDLQRVSDPAAQEAMKKRIDSWNRTVARYDSEPETNEGRKELAARAKDKEATRALAAQKKEIFEVAAKLFQIAIIIASAVIITGIGWLGLVSAALGLGGTVLMGFALWAPTAIHLPF